MPPTKRYGASLNVACTPELKEQVVALAGRQGRIPADVVRAAVQAYITKEAGRRR